VVVLILSWVFPIGLAQTDVNFTSSDKFDIPASNGTITFAANGSYAWAGLENGVWRYMNLRINGSQPLENFQVSAQDSNVKIVSYRAGNTTLSSARLRVVVEGRGKLTFNMGIDVEQGDWGGHPDWSVIVNGVWMGERDVWSIAPDGTLTINGVDGNVSIAHYGFLEAMGSENSSNQPFHQKHSVAIIITVVVAIIVIIAIAIGVRNKKRLE
jgi:hypothetical protein